MPNDLYTSRRRRIDFARRLTLQRNTAEVGAKVTKFTVSGVVKDDSDTEVESVVVTIGGETDTTDASGIFSIADVPVSSTNLNLALAGYQEKDVTVTIKNANLATGDITLNEYFDIAGNCVNDSAAAVEGATINLYAEAEKTTLLATTTTDASGDYTLTADASGDPDSAEIIAGSWYVEAIKTGHTADEDPLTVEVTTAAVADADFVLTVD